MKSIVTIFFLLSSVLLLILFIRGLVKKEPIKFLCFKIAGSIAFAFLSIIMLNTDSEQNLELSSSIMNHGDVRMKYSIKPPSILDKLTGNDNPILTLGSSGGPGTLSITARTSEPIPDSVFHISKGKEFITYKHQSGDGKEHTFDVALPEGQEIRIAIPAGALVTLADLTNQQPYAPPSPPQTTDTPKQ